MDKCRNPHLITYLLNKSGVSHHECIQGNAFTEFYYAAQEGGYFDDYERVLQGDLPSTYHVENSWENYDKIAVVITDAYVKWKQN